MYSDCKHSFVRSPCRMWIVWERETGGKTHTLTQPQTHAFIWAHLKCALKNGYYRFSSISSLFVSCFAYSHLVVWKIVVSSLRFSIFLCIYIASAWNGCLLFFCCVVYGNFVVVLLDSVLLVSSLCCLFVVCFFSSSISHHHHAFVESRALTEFLFAIALFMPISVGVCVYVFALCNCFVCISLCIE